MDFTGNTLKLIGSQVSSGNIGSQLASLNPVELVIDNYMEQDFHLPNIVTRQPTSRGTPNNDFMYREPWIYSIRGLLSSSTLSSSLDFNLGSFEGANSYLSTKFSQAMKLALGQYIFTAYTGVGIFPSLGILDLYLHRDKKRYNCLEISLVLQELMLASTSNSYTTKNNEDRPPADQGIKNG